MQELEIPEIEKGEFFTVEDNGMGGRDRSWIGDLFEAVSIDGDLIAAREITRDLKLVLKTKGMKLRLVSREFIDDVRKMIGQDDA